MKPLVFMGSSLDDLRDFPMEVRKASGFELYAMQRGFEPGDWKPMHAVGQGVKEIRIHVLGNSGLYMWPKEKMLSMSCTHFTRKIERQTRRILSWPGRDISR